MMNAPENRCAPVRFAGWKKEEKKVCLVFWAAMGYNGIMDTSREEIA